MQGELKGSIQDIPTESGDTHYRVYIDLPTREGDRRRETETFHTLEEAKRYQLEMNLLIQDQKNELNGEAEDEHGLIEFVKYWLSSNKNGMRPTTVDKYERAIDHLESLLSEVTVESLTPFDVQDYYEKKQEEGLSSSSVRIHANVLSQAMDLAVKQEFIKENPVKKITAPQEEKKELNYLAPEEAERLLEGAEGHWPYEGFLHVVIKAGLRRGEMLGLKWKHVDLDNRTLSVQRQITPVKGKLTEGPLKTESSYRTLDLCPQTVDVLRRHRKEQDRLRNEADEWPRPDLVFSSTVGTVLRPRNIRRALKKHFENSGCPVVSIQELRHTCATLWLSHGENVKVVARRLGHSDISVTLARYHHVMPSAQREAAARIGNLLDS